MQRQNAEMREDVATAAATEVKRFDRFRSAAAHLGAHRHATRTERRVERLGRGNVRWRNAGSSAGSTMALGSRLNDEPPE